MPAKKGICDLLMLTNLSGFGAGGGVPTIALTISSNQNKYNAFTAAGSPAYKCNLVITVNSGIYVYSDSTATAALTIGGFNAASTISITNSGFILGCGGGGGNSRSSGAAGGKAIEASGFLLIIDTSAGWIGGGGGGGGGD